jgi:uncharacterized cupredoxin-like copper-binding protein
MLGSVMDRRHLLLAALVTATMTSLTRRSRRAAQTAWEADVTVILPNHGMTLHNFSTTDHNNPDVPNLGIDVDLAVGTTETVTINAPAGDYYFFCNVPGHEAAGMFGTLHVE